MDVAMWGPIIIAGLCVISFLIICVVSLWKHTASEAAKIIGVAGSIFGTLLGAMGTYFFTRPQYNDVKRRAEVAETRLTAVQREATQLEKLAKAYATTGGLTSKQIVEIGKQYPALDVKAEPLSSPWARYTVTPFEDRVAPALNKKGGNTQFSTAP